jgi:hypothetical protein
MRVVDREWPQDHTVYDGEYRRVRADAEAESKNNDERESWIFCQHSQREADVLPERLHSSPP